MKEEILNGLQVNTLEESDKQGQNEEKPNEQNNTQTNQEPVKKERKFQPKLPVKSKSDLFVFTKIKDLAKYILTVTEKSPKKFRYTLVVRLQNYILDVIELVYNANTLPLGAERRTCQEKAKTKLSLLDYYAGICYEVECITMKQYTQISKQMAECLMYLGKWIASDAKRAMAQLN